MPDLALRMWTPVTIKQDQLPSAPLARLPSSGTGLSSSIVMQGPGLNPVQLFHSWTFVVAFCVAAESVSLFESTSTQNPNPDSVEVEISSFNTPRMPRPEPQCLAPARALAVSHACAILQVDFSSHTLVHNNISGRAPPMRVKGSKAPLDPSPPAAALVAHRSSLQRSCCDHA